jgi:parallel beta-helix repeat protein
VIWIKIKKIILTFLIIFLILLHSNAIVYGFKQNVSQQKISSNVLYVDDDADPIWYNETQFKTIREAINTASDEDTIFVYNGTYFENYLRIDKKITIIGEDKNTTIIDAQSEHKCIILCADNIVFSGFTLKNNTYLFDYWYNSLLEINKSTEVTVKNNIFINTQRTEKPTNVCGMCILQSINCILRNNKFIDCNLLIYYLDYNDGFKSKLSYYIHDIDKSNTANEKPINYIKNKKNIDILEDSGQVILVNCSYCRIANQIIKNMTNSIELFYSNYNIIENNQITGTLQGFWTEYADYNIFRNNTFTNVSCSMWLSFSDYNTFTNNSFTMITIEQKSKYNIFRFNQFYSDNQKNSFNIQLDDSDLNIFENNNIYSYGLISVKVWGKCRHNSWDRNYWNKWIGLKIKILKFCPKFIICWHRSLYDSFLHHPKKLNFPSYILKDYNPALEPYKN